MADFLLECGGLSIDNLFPGVRTLAERVIKTQEHFEEQTGRSLEVLIYSSCGSANSGGRRIFQKPNEMRDTIHDLNKSNSSFSLALNGSLTVKDARLDTDEKSILGVMDMNNRSNGLNNSVTVTNPQISHEIRSEYPNLRLIASCIQQLDPNTPFGYGREGYRARAKEFDEVVVLPQHTTAGFLAPLKDIAKQLIVFLTLKCGHGDLYQCYEHYYRQETAATNIPLTRFQPVSRNDYPREIIAASDYACGSCYLGGNQWDCAALESRPKDFGPILESGIKGFKLARDYIFSIKQLDELITDVRRHSP